MRDSQTGVRSAVRADSARTVGVGAWDPDEDTPHTRGWKIRRCLLIGWDAVGWAAALLMAAALRGELQVDGIDLGPLMNVIAIAIAAQLLIGGTLQTYRGRHCAGSVEDAINVTGATVLTGSTVFLIDFFTQPPLVPRSIPLLAIPIAVLHMVGSRVIVRMYRERRSRPDQYTARRVLIYGAGPAAQNLLRIMLADPEGGYLPVALLDDDRRLRRRRINGVAVRGTRHDIAAAAAESRADMLVIADRSLPLGVLREVAGAADAAGLTVSMVPSLFELLQPVPPGLIPAPRTPATTETPDQAPERGAVAPEPRPSAAPAQSRLKRMLDLVLGLLGMLLVGPLLLVIATLLMVSGNEVIYRAERIGRDGRPFRMLKFATMVPGDTGPRVTTEGDPRITRIGHWLRVTKLNELPQILNVIKGDMSLVGPRPEDPRYAAHYSARHRPVLAVRPGMTSLAFLEFGDEQAYIARHDPTDLEAFYLQELLPEKLDIELQYLNNWTIREDLRILAQTFRGLLR
jgi:lipopolysaccharide/colanic/teichoic acid biosynthesis glycosyltransferase